jgi:RNA polymerase sigma factor (sigma-70 family)
MSQPTDLSLLTGCRGGDADAFGQFYARYRELIVGYLMRRVRDPELAADLMGETFAAALVAAMDVTRPLPDVPSAWLFTIARNLLIDSARRGRVEMDARRRLGLEPLVLEDADLVRIAEVAAGHDVVAELAKVVPAAEWDAFCAHVLEDETYPDIAERLKCSEALVRKRVSRAKAHLRTALGGFRA